MTSTTSPMVAFAVPRQGGALVPFAIQCGQEPAEREIYTPVDGYSWKLAKNCVLAAHNTYHGVLTHPTLSVRRCCWPRTATSRRRTLSRCCSGVTSKAPCRSTSSRSSC